MNVFEIDFFLEKWKIIQIPLLKKWKKLIEGGILFSGKWNDISPIAKKQQHFLDLYNYGLGTNVFMWKEDHHLY